jgi:hypothetical protein
MKGRRFHHLLRSVGVRHPCDLDLLLFFQDHPHSLLTSERLAAYVGYDLNQIARSLSLLTEAGLLTQSQNATHAARLYVLRTPVITGLTSLINIASTRAGRQSLLDAIKETAEVEAPADLSKPSDAVESGRRQTAAGELCRNKASLKLAS